MSEPHGQPQAPLRVHPATPGVVRGGVEEWREVPQALFLSWPVTQQLAYCAARDENAALNTYGDVWWTDFYTTRATSYKELYASSR